MEQKKLVTISAIMVVAVMALIIITSNTGAKFTVFAIVNTLEKCENVQVPYQVKEPYEAAEEYQLPLRYEVTSVQEDYVNNHETLTVKVKNVDSQGAVFTVRVYFKPLNGVEAVKESKQYIGPGEVKTFYQEYASNSAEGASASYVVIVGKKTEVKTLTKYRTVTKYRTEEICT